MAAPRNHRMNAMLDVDLLMRGRMMLRYDYRFLESLSLGLKAGIDWSGASVVAGLAQQQSTEASSQFSILAGLAASWQVTEWYMRSAFFVEPSLLFGHLWQELPIESTSHWRFRPGLFVKMQTIYNSGFTTSIGFGGELALDFPKNPLVQPLEPLIMIGFGFSA